PSTGLGAARAGDGGIGFFGDRSPAGRAAARARFGVAAEAEEAVDLALEWFAAHQEADGRWDGDGFPRHCPEGDRCASPAFARYDVALTSLALLCFLGAGVAPEEPAAGGGSAAASTHGAAVARAAAYLASRQDDAGGVDARNMYNHAIATLAAVELLFMGGDRYRPLAQRAVDFCAATQMEAGGWTYEPRPAAPRDDTSITGWMCMALVAADHAGLHVPEECLARMVGHFQRMTETDGRVVYADRGPEAGRASDALTAVGLYCRRLLGQPAGVEVNARAAARLLARPPVWSPGRDIHGSQYAWYYTTLAAFLAGGDFWSRWQPEVTRAILSGQRRKDHARGSFDPIDLWGVHGGRIAATAFCCLTLETAWRHGPDYLSPRVAALSACWEEAGLTARLTTGAPPAGKQAPAHFPASPRPEAGKNPGPR
ncbi:MAG: hypothetical protein HY719_17950, partial [Planctomycetes bacterium]|nr:hypothetical protein [Planctomycetota bacterium]